jgi:ubiquinone biosynthesis protein
MWQVAQPLIEEWMREHRGPEAQLAEFAADVIRTAERLPRAIGDIERAAGALASGDLRVQFGEGSARTPLWPLWLAIAVLAVLIIVT